MKDLIVLILFFAAYYQYGAEIAIIMSTTLEILFLIFDWISLRHFPVKQFWTRVFPGIFATALTFAFQDLSFFQYKATVLYAIFAGLCFGHRSFWGQIFTKSMQFDRIEEPLRSVFMRKVGWTFFVASLLNLVMMKSVDFSTWMILKTALAIGVTGCIVFFAVQAYQQKEQVVDVKQENHT